jgi:hypothetical protein
MVLVSNSIQELQGAFNDVNNWLLKNYFIINRRQLPWPLRKEENLQKASSAGIG